MTTATLKSVRRFGPDSAGIRMTPREFDRTEFVDGWRYELINGVLIVTPPPLPNESDPSDELGFLLRLYKRTPAGEVALDLTLPQYHIRTRQNRRIADRVIWVGLGRLPRPSETPSIIGEFVSRGKRDRKRDYEEKRDEYMAINVKEYWVIDRFQRTLTVFTKQRGRIKKRVLKESETYTTPLLPGFELPLAQLLSLANRWPEPEPGEE